MSGKGGKRPLQAYEFLRSQLLVIRRSKAASRNRIYTVLEDSQPAATPEGSMLDFDPNAYDELAVLPRDRVRQHLLGFDQALEEASANGFECDQFVTAT